MLREYDIKESQQGKQTTFRIKLLHNSGLIMF